MRTLAQYLSAAAERLESAGIARAEANASASVLARHALDWDRATFLARLGDSAPASFGASFEALVTRRAHREPVAYITGTREFYGRLFAVSPAVLIPRPETELVVDEALECLRAGQEPSAESREPTVADLGTGSGCLAITLALEWPAARVVATDTSEAALAVARRNAQDWRVSERVRLTADALVPNDAGPLDLIVSNPPYVPEADRSTLEPEVASFEPGQALFGGPDGLDVIRALAPAVARALAPRGWLVMEIGAGQADAARQVVVEAGLTVVRVRADLQAIPRVVVARAAS